MLLNDHDPSKTQEWMDALRSVVQYQGAERIVPPDEAARRGAARGCPPPFSATTPYVNTIPPEYEEKPQWDRELEHKIRSAIRWNAVAIILRANKSSSELGGHIASFRHRRCSTTLASIISSARRRRTTGRPGLLSGPRFAGDLCAGVPRGTHDGSSSELPAGSEARDCPSYPHPWLMADFWQFPTVRWALGR